MGFQTNVNTQPAPAVAGDFADANPRAVPNSGPGGFVSGANGLTVGRFAWWDFSSLDPNSAPIKVNNFGVGSVLGFVPRRQQALITTFLAESSMVIPQGYQVMLFSEGGFWAKNDGSTEAIIGMKAYANYADGKVTFAASGSPNNASMAAGAIAPIAATTATGSISGNIMTLTAIGGGTIYPGLTLSGVGVASGTRVVSQLTGVAGSTGTYVVSIPEQTVASTTLTFAGAILTPGTVTGGSIAVGSVLAGTGGGGVTSGTAVYYAVGDGTWVVSPSQTVTTSAITATTNVETKFVAMSAGAAGELVKISSHLIG